MTAVTAGRKVPARVAAASLREAPGRGGRNTTSAGADGLAGSVPTRTGQPLADKARGVAASVRGAPGRGRRNPTSAGADGLARSVTNATARPLATKASWVAMSPTRYAIRGGTPSPPNR